MVRMSIKEYNRLAGKEKVKRRTRHKTFCPQCDKPIKEHDSFICQEIKGEPIKKHLMCGLKNN